MSHDDRLVKTPHGDGRLYLRRALRPTATLLLSHGAGRGIDSPDLRALARHLPPRGVTVGLWEQPWVRQGRKVAPAPAVLDAGFRAVADNMRVRTPLVVGGRSAGARSALRLAKDLAASGVLALAFPLHPPGKPDRSRLEELTGSGVRTLVIQGERDPMGRPEEFPDPLPDGIELTVVPAADHGLAVAKRAPLSQADANALIVEATLQWVVREIVGNVPRL